MNALTQYTELYRQHRELLESRCGQPLNALRQKALDVLENITLPEAGTEHYRITSLNDMLAPDMGINVARVAISVDPSKSFHCGVPNMSSAHVFVLNDTCVLPADTNIPAAEGMYVGSLAEASREIPDVVSEYYGAAADINNPLVALNTLLCQDGVMIYIPDNVTIERPLQITEILNNNAPLMAVRRLTVVAGRNSGVKILTCDHTQNVDTDFLSLKTVEVFAGEGSRVDIYDIEESSRRTSRLSTLYLRQERDSNVLIDGITLYNGHSRNEYYCTFAGENADLRLLGMAIEDDRRVADTMTVIRHDAPHCHSDELFKYVIDDESKGEFAGLIYVAPGACKTEAYQSNRNLVGSSQARMYSKPQLEIYNDDVKCSHGAATGTLDESQLFYMRSRGLSLEQAKLLLKQAFMADVIDAVRLDSLKDRLRQLVERRFAGDDPSCATCHADCGAAIKHTMQNAD